MAISYKKLWKILIDKDMKKRPVCSCGYQSYIYGEIRKKRKCYNRCIVKSMSRTEL